MGDCLVDRALMDVMTQAQRLPKDTRAGLAAEWHLQVCSLLAGACIAPPTPEPVTLTVTVGKREALRVELPWHPATVGQRRP